VRIGDGRELRTKMNVDVVNPSTMQRTRHTSIMHMPSTYTTALHSIQVIVVFKRGMTIAMGTAPT